MENLCKGTCVFLSARSGIGKDFRKVKKILVLSKVYSTSSAIPIAITISSYKGVLTGIQL